MYIDDGPHNIVQLRAAGFNAIVFDQPYNQDLKGPRVKNWAELEEMVIELAADRLGSMQQKLPGVDAGADRIDRNRSED